MGAKFTDTLTIGWTTLKKPHESIRVDSDSITICGRVYTGIRLCDFLAGISPHVQKKTESLSAFKRYSFHTHPAQAPAVGPVLTRRDVRDQVQGLLDPNCSVVVDTGDSWFIGEELKLPFGAAYHVQMLVSKVGWLITNFIY
jgi:TPP-dependent 2-oxoacid decarboxylase